MAQATKLIASKRIPARRIERLNDVPKFQAPSGVKGWSGYFHFQDPTLLPFNVLTFPSTNCTIPNWDKVVPDKGKTLLGQSFTENVGMVGNKQRFTNAGGIEMEARVWKSADANLKDVIEIYWTNNKLLTGTVTGTFQTGETVTGGTSGSTGIILGIVGLTLTLEAITGNFTTGETITGGSSGATASVVSVPISLWHQISQNVNPIPRGVHEYYFDEWFDTKQISTIPSSVPGKNLQRMVWVNGYQDPSTKKGAVYSWTGGIALITAKTGTTITIDSSTTWRSLGFTTDAAGAAYVIVNGLSYTLTVPADLDTSVINVASTTGINVGDYAFSKIETDVAPIPFDVCKAYHGYMYYGNWTSKSLYQSNNFNRDYNYNITNYQALDNDITINFASAYTGATQSTYRIVVNSVNPNINTQTFYGQGLNDSQIETSGYSNLDGITHIYNINYLADFTLVCATGTPFTSGETITQATSGAQAIIVTVLGGGTAYGVKMITPFGFDTTNVITGSSSGSTHTPTQALYQDWVQYSKDNVVININTGSGSMAIAPINNASSITLSDGLTIKFGNFFGHTVGDSIQLTINKGGADTFTVQKDGGSISSPIAMTGSAQAIGSDGLQVTFQVKTGHAIGDFWDITAYPKIDRAFDNFYYALNRLVGEGYIYTLPTNFWAMNTQEEELYVNGTYGDWYQIKTTISVLTGNSASETLSADPLKQSGQNKVLYPYLTGHMNNELVYVTTNRTLDMLSRIIAVEKPQVSYLSDPVKFDFDACTFVGGRIQYHNKRLYISSPENSVTHCYDFFRAYWQPIKSFPEVGLMSIIGNNLIAHSNVRNQSFTMFTNSGGDNGSGYTVTMRTPYHAPNGKWKSTFSNQAFTEGYITGNPKLVHTVYEEVNGCAGIFPHIIEPVVCIAPDRASFGEGSFGSHPNGSDLDQGASYFKEIWKQYSPVMDYYFVALEISCTAKSHTWSILSLGLNGMNSPTGNNGFVAPSNLAINNVEE